ncbi:hypothetical protein [Methylomicrobium sp. Wu6]|uniref:hypothetical protein n=1 Tax=Methylomicrobium sp. Wu6 TaxID=3107928 RepID=UPI002DD67BFB|nr:hypothetical protein [Methylomicrobium sp. Wu6]MEC4748376.1 hypothetical protein [Methylomicrobium sp. Wu6]
MIPNKLMARRYTKMPPGAHWRFDIGYVVRRSHYPRARAVAGKPVTVTAERMLAWLWLPLAAMLVGCQTAATVKLPPSALTSMQSVLVVPMEAPPLEVYPDLLETRMPNVAHDYNMALPVTAEDAVYRNPGGILIAGKVGHGDSVETADLSRNSDASNQAAHWSPTRELSTAAKAQLDAAQIKAELNKQAARLPIATEERNANVGHWRDAVARWYGQNSAAPIDRTEAADAVLEVGIGQYRIFEGQTSLQVLIKLIDAHTGQVLAKTSKKMLSTGDSVPGLLYPEGERFKSLIRNNGARLVAEAIQDIGLTPMRLSKLSEPRLETNAWRWP